MSSTRTHRPFLKWKRRQELKKRQRERRRQRFELLEPRWLLTTIDFDYGLLLDPDPSDGADLTLRIVDDGGPVLQLFNNDNSTVMGQADFNDDIIVNIRGGNLADKLTIDFDRGSLNPAAVNIDVNVNGVDDMMPLPFEDVIEINPSGATIYRPSSLHVTLTEGDKISIAGDVSVDGELNLTAAGGTIEVLSGATITGGDITLAVNAEVEASGDGISTDISATPSATITVNGGSISGDHVTLRATATVDVEITTRICSVAPSLWEQSSPTPAPISQSTAGQ